MGCVFVPAVHQVAAHLMTDAGTRTDALRSGSDSALGVALLPLLALAAALVAAVAVVSLIVAWLRKPEPTGLIEVTDPKTAGLMSVGFAAGMASRRWLAATVVQLACDRVITIDDRRSRADAAGGTGGTAGADASGATGRSDGSSGRPNDVRLVFGTANAEAERAAAGVLAGAGIYESEGGVVAAVFEPSMTGVSGGSRDPVPGTSVDVNLVVTKNGSLAAFTGARFREVISWYREPRPVARFRVASICGVLGIVLGFISLGLDDASNSIAWSAMVIGAVALGLRLLMPRWIPLNAVGLLLRERANQLREIIATAEVPTLASGEQVLPWAVLFDEQGTIRRVAEAAEGSGGAPSWYRSTEPFTADRLVSCLEVLTAELSQPIRVGAKAPWTGDDGRFGVPLVGDYRGWVGAYYYGNAGWGGTPGPAGFDGGTAGGLDGGGFDGGGFGGFDGGGVGGDGGGGF